MSEWAHYYYQNYAFGLSPSKWRGHMGVVWHSVDYAGKGRSVGGPPGERLARR